MSFSKSVYRIIFSALLAAVVCGAMARGLAGHGDADWGKPENGLQISISRVDDDGKPNGLGVIQINLHNTGKKDLYTIPGMLQDCGLRNLAGNIKLRMTDSTGTVMQLTGPFALTCDAAIEPFTLPLPAGTVFSVPINLNRYLYAGADGKEFPAPLFTKLKPGEFSIEAEFAGTDVGQYDDLRTGEQMREDQAKQRVMRLPMWATMDAWHGTVKSNKFKISYASEDLSKKYYKNEW
jgi:hypothetical protein